MPGSLVKMSKIGHKTETEQQGVWCEPCSHQAQTRDNRRELATQRQRKAIAERRLVNRQEVELIFNNPNHALGF